MDTILLVIGVIGLSISGWVLRGYFLNGSSRLTSSESAETDFESEEEDELSASESPSYVLSEEHQQVLLRLEQLEKMGVAPGVEQNGSLTHESAPAETVVMQTADLEKESTSQQSPALDSERWQEIFGLQDAYRQQREKEQDIDYEREQALFDLTQGFDGIRPLLAQENDEEENTEQRFLDNRLEEGIPLDEYQERMSRFASLSREMLVMRLEAADIQLREQQETHQKSLLSIIASLIEKMPGDVNLKSVAQASFVAASTEISNVDGAANRENFQQMFFEQFGH